MEFEQDEEATIGLLHVNFKTYSAFVDGNPVQCTRKSMKYSNISGRIKTVL